MKPKGWGLVNSCGWVTALMLAGVATAFGNPSAAQPADSVDTPNVVEFLPQGRVSSVEAVQVGFSTPVAAFGEPNAKPPFMLECQGQAPQGQGRWLDDTRWTYVFERTLPAGVRCAARINPEFRDLNGQPLSLDAAYQFDTGAPSVVDLRPHQGTTIDEAQVFILKFDAGVDADAVVEHSHCAVSGLAEKIPVRPVADVSSEALMRIAYLEAPDDPASVALLQCARVLPPEAQVRLEVGPGLMALNQPDEIPASQRTQSWEFEVRPAFTAALKCTRERAGRPCLPITPIAVEFSAPVRAAALKGVRLTAGDTVFEQQQNEAESDFITRITFSGPFPAKHRLSLQLPGGLRDDAGRPLENAGRFPLEVEVADYPPLAKFASATFGVVERFAHARPGHTDTHPPTVPVTLRHVEAQAPLRSLGWSSGQVSSLRTVNDAEVLGWYARLQRLDGGRWSREQVHDILAGVAPRQTSERWESRLDARAVSLLKGQPSVRQMELPGAPQEGTRPFEVVGVPLDEPGFHVLEIESPRLGESLLEEGVPMYVRTGVLLTNLSLHIKQGRDDLLVWVTTLADAQPVAEAEITVLDCRGNHVISGQTDEQGLWHYLAPIDAPNYCNETGLEGLFVSAWIPAEHPLADGSADYSFVLSSWDRGIESWRFNVPTTSEPQPTLLTHTVLDRSLFRAGETVAMKHYVREETRDGMRVPPSRRPDRLVIAHEGSSQRYELPVTWQETPSGGLMALNQFELPESAHLGTYSARLTDKDNGWFGSTSFRVEEFRLPILTGRLAVRSAEKPGMLVAPQALTVDMQLAWLSGGPAMGQSVELSAMAEARWVNMGDYEEYSFASPPTLEETEQGDTVSEEDTRRRRRLLLDGRRFKLDANGTASVEVRDVPATDRPLRYVFEAGFADPNGEFQTLSQTVDVWPASVQAGLKVESWNRAGKDIPVSLIALGIDGRPRQGVAMRLLAVERQTYTVRKRMVGGFYRYDSHTERREMGTVCEGKTNGAGLLLCSANFNKSGAFELVAVATDEEGRESRAYSTVWLTGAGELWFDGADDDRISLVPTKREWAIGDQAEFQVHMPFREALALVSVEREGVLWTQLQRLAGDNPVVKVPVSSSWAPNAYVSVLVLRGRLYELPQQSRVTHQVDLAKPSFRLGLAELRVAGTADRLNVELTPQSDVLQVKQEGSARVKVTLPDGSPAAKGTVAFAVVDEALLELAPNNSWALYDAMHPRRSLGVRTATGQMEVVGRRHYGRKAVAAGGGGGNLPTRQLFDTLISWQPAVQLDDKGEAELRFHMNDSLSRFRLIALADHGAAHFGSGDTTVVTRQDLQVVSGLPPLVREADRYQATVTVRNGSNRAGEVDVSAVQNVGGKSLRMPSRKLRLEPGEAGSVSWEVVAPSLQWPDENATIQWHFEAEGGHLEDSVMVEQRLAPRRPVSTIQATMLGLEAGESMSLPVAVPRTPPADSDAARTVGGVIVDVAASLAGGLEGVQNWWRAYPYTCLEQSASQAIALRDADRWSDVVGRLVTHMDDDGLLRYFPGSGQGSEVLSAYLITVTAEAHRLGVDMTLPPAATQRMLDGLQAFAEGRLKRDTRLSNSSLDSRRLMAMEALARHGRMSRGLLSSLSQSPEHWPTATVVDWLSVLMRMPEEASRAQEIAQARSILMSRMTVSGAAMTFSDAPLNAAPGLMATRVTSLAQLILTVADDPHWREDLPRLVQGLISLQEHGRWAITTENLLGELALARYAQLFESEPASGEVHIALADMDAVLALPDAQGASTARLNWPVNDSDLELLHKGEGTAWVGVRAQAQRDDDAPANAGYRINRRVIPVQKQQPGVWSRGDIYRVELEIHSRDAASWVVLDDPVPAGATILGSGLGRDATIPQTHDTSADYPPAFVERSAAAYRAYFDYLPAGRVRVSYTVRLNAVGDFALPPTRVHALYRPDLYGSLPNHEGVTVSPGAKDETAGR